MQADGFALVIMPTRIAILQLISSFVRIAGVNFGAAARRQIADASERGGGIGTVNHLMERCGGRINVKESLPYRVDGASWVARPRRGSWGCVWVARRIDARDALPYRVDGAS